MNLPNRLTVLRILLVPVFMVFLLLCLPGTYGEIVSRLLAAALFGAAAITDFADGKIARSRNLITDFGKFLDPLADKFMIFGAILGFCSSAMYRASAALHLGFVICGAVVIFRELAVTSLRLVVSTSKKPVVIAASWYGKAKTVSQCVWVVATILEPVLMAFVPFWSIPFLSWATLFVMTGLTVFSGVDYMKQYWGYLDPTK